MNRIYILIALVLCCVSGQALTQSVLEPTLDAPQRRNSLALVTGYQFQRHHFIDFGIGLKSDLVGGHHPSTFILAYSNEFKVDRELIWGPKLGVWLGGGVGGLNLGLNMISYTNFEESTLRFRPEIGFGFDFFRVVYGYNSALTNRDFPGINRHNFGINFMIGLFSLD